MKSLDYYVRDKTLLESVLDLEFEAVIDKGFFYNGELTTVTKHLS